MTQTTQTMVCQNIGRGQRRIRYLSAIAAAAIALALYMLLVATGAVRWWRLLLILPVIVGVNAYLEASQGLCILLASREEESLDDQMDVSRTMRGDKMKKIEDPVFRAALHAQARKMQRQGLILATAITAVLVLIP